MGREHHQDVKPCSAGYVGQLPNGSQTLTGVAVIPGGSRGKHDVIFEKAAESGPMVGSHGAGVDQGRGLLEHRVSENTPVVHRDVFPLDPHGHEAFLDGRFQFTRGREVIPHIAFDPYHIIGAEKTAPSG
jgi:hypothetical protein